MEWKKKEREAKASLYKAPPAKSLGLAAWYACKHNNELRTDAFKKRHENKITNTLKIKNMPAWVVPAITAAAGLIGQGIARGKDRRQLNQQGKLNDLQIQSNEKMLGIQNKYALEMWEKTGPQGQMEQLTKAGLNPGLLYGMGGAGGQSLGTQDANVTGGKAQGSTGNETEQTTAMAMQLIAQTELLKSQKENIDADTANKKAGALDTGEAAIGKQYDNIIKDILTNRDKQGNEITDPSKDTDRIAVQEKIQNLIKTELESKNIDENTAKMIAEVAIHWKELSIQEREIALKELMNKQGMENKDEDQIINVINAILGAFTHGLINLRGKRPLNMSEDSYENKDGIQTYRSRNTRYHK